MREDNFFLLLAVIIGLFAGLAVVCFRIAIDYTRLWLLGSAIAPGPLRVICWCRRWRGWCWRSWCSVFPAGTWQRRHADQVGGVHLRRLHTL